MGLLLVRVLVAPATELATNAVVQATTGVGMGFITLLGCFSSLLQPQNVALTIEQLVVPDSTATQFFCLFRQLNKEIGSSLEFNIITYIICGPPYVPDAIAA